MATPIDRSGIPKDTQLHEQYVLNRSFDPKFDVLAVETLVYNPTTDSLDRVSSQDNTQNFVVSDVDDANAIRYYGYLNKDGGWYIMKEDTGSSPKTYRYVAGSSSYTTNWTGRAGLTYGYFDVVF